MGGTTESGRGRAPRGGAPGAEPEAGGPPEGSGEHGAREPNPPAALSRREFLHVAAGKVSAAVAAFAAGFLVDFVWARLVRGFHLERRKYPKLVLGRYRIHHNVVGYVAILVGLVWQPLVLVPFGVGMIVGHKRRDRLLWFVERVG